VSSAERPWWATDDDSAAGPGTDPLEQHRAARRGDPGAASGPRPEPDSDPDADPDSEAPPTGDRGPEDTRDGGHHVDVCGICPICVGLRALGESRPELVGHLAEAARQLTLAVRSVVEGAAPADDVGHRPRSGGPGPGAPEDLRRIPLDD
jgi:hypothetical protein